MQTNSRNLYSSNSDWHFDVDSAETIAPFMT